ncbi:MAG TPA: PQQ-binding-like beta-propeller repeat protein [Bryobacteraceae bacterium]|nr:PQQ-binding-like beta-propeller repeat protein [Bryobacteraceae bacterium]
MKLRAILFVLSGFAAAIAQDAQWSQWRGPLATGHAPKARNLPVTWSESENIVWKTKLPSWSAATPVVWGNLIFVTTAEAGFVNPTYDTRKLSRAAEKSNDKIYLLALDRATGKEKWRAEVDNGNQLYRKQNSSSPSPITDGKHVWMMTGNVRLFCFTVDGKPVWKRDFVKEYGDVGLNHGYASTPLLDGNRLYVQVIHGYRSENPSYTTALDKLTGKTIWKELRPAPGQLESKDNYGTPQMALVNGKKELVVFGGDVATGQDPDTGKELWRLGGFNPPAFQMNRTIAGLLIVGDQIVVGANRGKPYISFKAGGRGDVTGKNELWTNALGPDVPTSTTDGQLLYVLKDNGTINCLDLKTGKPVYESQRIELGTYSSSPLLADGKLYSINEDGTTTVIKAGSKFEILGVSKLDGYTLASPIAVDDQLFIRTGEALYCIGLKKGNSRGL